MLFALMHFCKNYLHILHTITATALQFVNFLLLLLFIQFADFLLLAQVRLICTSQLPSLVLVIIIVVIIIIIIMIIIYTFRYCQQCQSTELIFIVTVNVHFIFLRILLQFQ